MSLVLMFFFIFLCVHVCVAAHTVKRPLIKINYRYFSFSIYSLSVYCFVPFTAKKTFSMK